MYNSGENLFGGPEISEHPRDTSSLQLMMGYSFLSSQIFGFEFWLLLLFPPHYMLSKTIKMLIG